MTLSSWCNRAQLQRDNHGTGIRRRVPPSLPVPVRGSGDRQMEALAVCCRAARDRHAARTMGIMGGAESRSPSGVMFNPSAELARRAHLPVEEPEQEPPDEEPPDTEPPIEEPPVNDPPVNEPPVEDPSALKANDSWNACSCADMHLLRQARRRYGATEFMQSFDLPAGGRIRRGSLCRPEGQGTIPDRSCVCVRNVDRSSESRCIYNEA